MPFFCTKSLHDIHTVAPTSMNTRCLDFSYHTNTNVVPVMTLFLSSTTPIISFACANMFFIFARSHTLKGSVRELGFDWQGSCQNQGPLGASRCRSIRTFVKVGLGISRTNANSQWNSVISSNFLLWKRNDSSVHVTLTRQTCGQRSSRAAESKGRALGNYFFERICYMFPISKCRGD